MQKRNKYERLSGVEREEISRGIAQGESIMTIVGHTGKSGEYANASPSVSLFT